MRKASKKRADGNVWTDKESYRWCVSAGRLVPAPGRPRKVRNLFDVVAEKLPKGSLAAVKQHLRQLNKPSYGVYVVHDSMGYARYIGRGAIFDRLNARFKAQPIELMFYSFYLIEDRKHEREIETLLIRAAGPHLHFNDKKRRIDIEPGDVRDFEAGTRYLERQRRRGRRAVTNIG